MRQATLKFKKMLKPMEKDKVKNITYPIVDSAGKVIELD